MKIAIALVALTLFFTPGTIDAQEYQLWGYFLYLGPTSANQYTGSELGFKAIRDTCDSQSSQLITQYQPLPDPRTSDIDSDYQDEIYECIYYVYQDAQFVAMGTHSATGNILNSSEIYETADQARARADVLIAQGRLPDAPGWYLNGGPTTGHSIGMSQFVQQDSIRPMNSDFGGIALLQACKGEFFPHVLMETSYKPLGAPEEPRNVRAVIYTKNSGDFNLASRLLMYTFACKCFWHPAECQIDWASSPSRYNSWMGEGERLMTDYFANHTEDASEKMYFAYKDAQPVLWDSETICVICKITDADFQSAEVVGGQIRWTVLERSPTDYYVLGFNGRGTTPVSVQRIEGHTSGGFGRSIVYTASAGGASGPWEIVAVDRSNSAAQRFSGYLEPTSQEGKGQDALQDEVTLSDEELYGELTLGDGEPQLFSNEQLRDLGSSKQDHSTLLQLSPSLRGLAVGASESCECDSAVSSDSTLCGDYLVVSSNLLMLAIAALRQSDVHGRPVGGLLDTGGDPTFVPGLMRSIRCNNLAWNAWAEAANHPRKFPEFPFLVIVGSPGTRESSHIVDPIVAYPRVPGRHCIGLGCFADGWMACPLVECGDSTMAPYTRIPARSLDDINDAYDAAEEYVAGVHVAVSSGIARAVGDYASVPNQCYPEDEGFRLTMERSSHHAFGQKYPVRLASDCDNAPDQLQADINNGASLVLSLGNVGDSYWWPVEDAWKQVEDSLHVQQRVVGVMSFCNSTKAIYEANLDTRPLCIRLLFDAADRTQFVFTTGFSAFVSDVQAQWWFRNLMVELSDFYGDSPYWQEVVSQAINHRVAPTRSVCDYWRVSNIGAPTRVPDGVAVGVPELAETQRLQLTIHRNPIRHINELAVTISTVKSGRGVLRIFDVAGRIVAQPIEINLVPGQNNVSVGSFLQGQLSGGVYFVKIDHAGQAQSGKLLIVR